MDFGKTSVGTDSDSNACERLVDWIEALNRDLDIPRLGECRGVTREALVANAPKMASDSLASGSPANNPRVPSEEDIISLYLESF